MDAAAAALHRRVLIAPWSTTPIPNLSLSAGALLALADLHTIAQRTALTGGSSWLDTLVLAPGLHYQQAADAIDRQLDVQQRPTAVEARGGAGVEARYVVNNAAMVGFLKRMCSDDAKGDDPVTLDVMLDTAGRVVRRGLGDFISLGGDGDTNWFSHALYLASPLLTAAAVAFLILLEDWWALGCLGALMLSRLLNIYVIKQRAQPTSPAPSPGGPGDTLTEYSIDLGLKRRAVLRGRPSDLQAVTTQAWLRGKTHAEGYFEAAAKLIVYLVAAFSGNLTQAGAMVFMALLLLSAGLLGLSNAHLKDLRMHGRVAKRERHKVKSFPVQGSVENGDRRVTM
ncbi:hypothetical protein S40285_06705 [Stachybotrys chlorohalonatus IBT 40285]|uniref:Uncharacterized protein n=1 Tax=Stachybotrys chlorohalonatus (strain IBT 40285) TaxID=1283841 RepID=A0A084QTH4_STAC4|nr:hypothetical protein S40285_06705 [Stachybotrys chlorohalonata IBT 40285]